jgi:ABC-type multidrug transport system fused ATPase/permease subunit
LLVGALFILVYVSINLVISVPLTLIVCILAGVSYFFIIPKFKIGFTQGTEEKSITDNISSFLSDKLAGIKTVKSFNNEKLHFVDFSKLAERFKRLQIKIQKNRILANIYLEPFVTFLVIGLLLFGLEILHLPVVYLLTFFYIFSRIVPKIKLINGYYLNIMNFLPHFSKIQRIIDKEDKIYLSEGTREIPKIRDRIELRGIFFKYPDTQDYALKDITICIEKNKTTALIGASGGGKTTIVDLILRHHDPQRGIISVDGIDLREIKRQSWHKLVSIVEQDAYLFDDTVYNNILYGKTNADPEEVFHAARLANAHGFIQGLPYKYNTLVGTRGIKLSGGQKQRISLARALLRDPEILILDEATSALDSKSERLIQDAIEKLSSTKTIVIIAHRLSSVSKADKLFVIENAELVESGTFEELLSKNGMFKKYYSLQH